MLTLALAEAAALAILAWWCLAYYFRRTDERADRIHAAEVYEEEIRQLHAALHRHGCRPTGRNYAKCDWCGTRHYPATCAPLPDPCGTPAPVYDAAGNQVGHDVLYNLSSTRDELPDD